MFPDELGAPGAVKLLPLMRLFVDAELKPTEPRGVTCGKCYTMFAPTVSFAAAGLRSAARMSGRRATGRMDRPPR